MTVSRATHAATITAGVALLAVVVIAPGSSLLRVPLALVAIAWAPGHALVTLALRSRPSRGLERHALAVGVSLLLVPLVGLATSLLVGFTALHVATAYALLDSALGALALALDRSPESPLAPTASIVPGPRATAALVAGCLLAAGAVAALPFFQPDAVPLSLALLPEDGDDLHQVAIYVLAGETLRYRVELRAGEAPANGTLRATLRADGPLPSEVGLGNETVTLLPYGVHSWIVEVPSIAHGDHTLTVDWTGDEPRTVHVRIFAREPIPGGEA